MWIRSPSTSTQTRSGTYHSRACARRSASIPLPHAPPAGRENIRRSLQRAMKAPPALKNDQTQNMKKNAAAEKDAQFYQHMQQALLYHQYLLRDEVRNKLFYEALRRTVMSESRVLDIGSGSGVWAIAAAKLGAKSVTAIETNDTMIPMIMAHAAE